MVSKTITFMIVLILFSMISSLKLKTKEEVEAGHIPSIEECDKQGKYWYMFKCHKKLNDGESCWGKYHNACKDGAYCKYYPDLHYDYFVFKCTKCETDSELDWCRNMPKETPNETPSIDASNRVSNVRKGPLRD